MPFVAVPAGRFLMGSDEAPEALARDYPHYPRERFTQLFDEAPVHAVRITRPFQLMATEVTVGQFRRFLRDGMAGEQATMDDWALHLSTLIPEARLKQYLEVRGCDAGSFEMIANLSAEPVDVIHEGTEVIVLCMGPEAAGQTVRKALSYGLDGAIQVTDEACAGSDALATARVLAAALDGEEFDLIIMGNQSSDARTMLVPAMLAEFLDLPALTYAKKLEVDGTKVTAHRETPTGHEVVEAELPVVVSVVEAINEPRYPSFKGIMAAKKKPLDTKDLAAVGVDAGDVGLPHSWTEVLDVEPRPPKQAGEKVEDDGSGQVGAEALVEFLTRNKFV